MEQIIQELKSIQNKAVAVIEEIRTIRINTYPLNDVIYLSDDNKARYNKLVDTLEQLIKMYDDTYRQIPLSERKNVKYFHITWKKNDMLLETKGLASSIDVYDESEIQKSFKEVTNFAKKAIEELVKYEKELNQDKMNQSVKIINVCKNLLASHHWGESYLNDINAYEIRIRSGRTTQDDITDYLNFIEKAEATLMLWAEAIVNEKYSEIETIRSEYEAIINSCDLLIRTIPIGEIKYVNLHWKKLEMLENPKLYLEKRNNSELKY